MGSIALAYPLSCGRGHAGCCSVALTNSGGWDVRVEIDDRVVLTTHCAEWHRVERLCAEFREQCWEDGASCHMPRSART